MSTTLLEPQYGDTRDGYTPSPDEIRQRCNQIQAAWSTSEDVTMHRAADLESLAAS